MQTLNAPRTTTPRLGDILVEHGIITAEQIRHALDVQSSTGQRLGSVLVGNGWATEEQVTEARAVQMEVGYVDLTREVPDPFAVALIPVEIAQRYLLLPLSVEDAAPNGHARIKLAMVDPWDVEAIDHVQRETRRRVEPLMASESGLQGALERAYHASQNDAHSEAMSETIELASLDSLDLAIPDEEELDLGDTVRQGEQAPVIRFVNTLFSEAVRRRTSDIHIEPRKKDFLIRYRIDGQLQTIKTVPRNLHAATVSRIKILGEMDIAERRLPLDGRIALRVEGKNIDLRVSTLPTQYGERVVMRILDRSTASMGLDELGFSPHNLNNFNSLIRKPHGIILVTGPTGSGKTTTLYAALNALRSPSTNIMTCEDPVEYELEGISQSNVNERAGLTFARQLPGHSASGPGRRPGRRNPGCGDGGNRLPGGADRPPRPVHAPLQRGGGRGEPPFGHGRPAVFDRLDRGGHRRPAPGPAAVFALQARVLPRQRPACHVPRPGRRERAGDGAVRGAGLRQVRRARHAGPGRRT